MSLQIYDRVSLIIPSLLICFSALWEPSFVVKKKSNSKNADKNGCFDQLTSI